MVVQRVQEDFCVKIVSVGADAAGILRDEEEVRSRACATRPGLWQSAG